MAQPEPSHSPSGCLIVTHAAGQDCHASAPGFFRICYAIVDKETILKLVERLTMYITKSDKDRKQIPLRVKPAALHEARKRAENKPTERAEPES